MDSKSYDDGRLGLPFGKDTDMDSYMAGKRAAESNTGVPGVAFTVLIVAPFLYLVYPVLGVVVMGIFLGVLYLMSLTPLPTLVFVLISVALGIAGFFPAYKLEAIVSQFAIYRFFRAVLRPIAGFGATVALRSGIAFQPNPELHFARAAGDKALEGVIVAVLVHFIFRRMDRIYFPVHTQVRRHQERLAKGLRDQRPAIKRILYSVVWIVPVVAILNLIIRLIVGLFTETPREIADFYQHYTGYIYILDAVAWVMLSFIGILPGTAKYRKYGVRYTNESL